MNGNDTAPELADAWDERTAFRAGFQMAIALRHRPRRLGLALDPTGWANVDDVIAGCRERGINLNEQRLRAIVSSGDQRRFVLSEDGRRIRATHGHSVPMELGYPPSTPPATLYHGTGAQNVASIQRQGILRRKRRFVHLGADPERAMRVARKRGDPVIFAVDASRMTEDGAEFYLSENGIWLVEHVPARHVRLIAAPECELPGDESERSSPAREER